MLKQKLAVLLRRRYFWRDIGFDELSELYVSNMLHTFAVSLLLVFVPYYLYQNHFSVSQICLVYGSFFMTRIFIDFVAAHAIARYGPKHSMIVSCLLQIVSASLFLTLPYYHWPFWLLGSIYGAAASFFFIPFHVEFSKIKHTKHAGKELGYMQMLDKTGAVLGPLVGGLAAHYFGPQAIFLLAVGFLFGSLWPLFQSAEPVRTHQKLDYRTLPLHRIKHDLITYVGSGVENTLCINAWPFYVSLFALSGAVYAQLGMLTAFGVLVSIGSAYPIGKAIDGRNPRRIMHLSVILNSSLYVFRPLVHSVIPAYGINMSNEIVTTGYRMPMLKGVYAAADDLPGHRIVYISTLEACTSLCKATAWLILAIVATSFSAYSTFVVAFFIAGTASFFMLAERFKALTPKKRYNLVYGQAKQPEAAR